MMGKADARWVKGGDLLVNGVECEMARFKKAIGYVAQDDIMQRGAFLWFCEHLAWVPDFVCAGLHMSLA